MEKWFYWGTHLKHVIDRLDESKKKNALQACWLLHLLGMLVCGISTLALLFLKKSKSHYLSTIFFNYSCFHNITFSIFVVWRVSLPRFLNSCYKQWHGIELVLLRIVSYLPFDNNKTRFYWLLLCVICCTNALYLLPNTNTIFKE